MPFTAIGINETPDVAPAVLEARLARLLELGYEAVEVRLHHVGVPAGAEPVLLGGRLNQRRLAELAASLDRFPLRRTLHASATFPMEPALRPIGEEIAASMVELAAALRAEVIVVHPGTASAEDGPEAIAAEIERQRQIVASMALGAAEFGARVALENMTSPRSYSADPEALCAEVQTLNAAGHENVGVCLDIGHLALSATSRGFDLAAAVRRLAPLVVHTHMSDNFGRPTVAAGLSVLEQMRYGTGDLHLPLGWGSIPHEALFAGADFARDPIFLYELNQALRGSMIAGTEEQMVADARRLVRLSRGEPLPAGAERTGGEIAGDPSEGTQMALGGMLPVDALSTSGGLRARQVRYVAPRRPER